MDLMKELFIVVGRIVTILPLLLMITLYMGRRSTGELPVFDFLVIITLASVTGADIADPSISHIYTVVAIVLIGIIQRLVASSVLSYRKFGKMITFEPAVVVRNGQILKKNLRKIRFSVDNILQMLREKDVFDIQDVDLAIIEANGSISVHKKTGKSNVTIEDLKIVKKSIGISFPVIIEGKIEQKMLNEVGITRLDLLKKLKEEGIAEISTIFLATINKNKELHLSFSNQDEDIPPIQH